MAPYPQWLHILAWAYLSLSFDCAAITIADEFRRPQKMMIMNFVWPITALYAGPVALWGYFNSGPKLTTQHHQRMQQETQAELQREILSGMEPMSNKSEESGPSRSKFVGTSHCGAGCTLGDIGAAWWILVAGLAFAGGIFVTRILLDFLLAWGFGVVTCPSVAH